MKDYFTKAFRVSLFKRIESWLFFRRYEANPISNTTYKARIELEDWEPGQKEFADNGEPIC